MVDKNQHYNRTNWCMFIDKDYFKQLDSKIEAFSTLMEVSNFKKEGTYLQRYLNITMELVRHKIRLMDIMNIREIK